MNRPLRIGLLAEGEAELGYSVPYLKPEEGGKVIDSAHEGALHTLIRRELQAIGLADCQFVHRYPTIKERGGIKPGYEAKIRTGHGILDLKYLAQTVINWKPHEIDMVVILVDSDEELSSRQIALQKAMDTIAKYHFNQAGQATAQQSAGGLAIKNFDTWLLADKVALETLLQVELPADLPIDLENITNAKLILEQAINESPTASEGLLPMKWELAKLIDLLQIKQRCQQGYGQFMLAVGQMALSLSNLE